MSEDPNPNMTSRIEPGTAPDPSAGTPLVPDDPDTLPPGFPPMDPADVAAKAKVDEVIEKAQLLRLHVMAGNVDLVEVYLISAKADLNAAIRNVTAGINDA